MAAVPLVSLPKLDTLRTGALADSPEVQDWAARYQSADPFPHIVLDGLFPEEALRVVLREIEADEINPESEFYGSHRKRRSSDTAELGPATRTLIEELNSAAFLKFLEQLTGVPHLIPDPYLEGGGVHQIPRGGFLKIHTDFNWHRHLHLHRRLNLLLYLNDAWEDAWGGHLELWTPNMKECRAKIAPIFNRMVVFSTTDNSYHGHPDPLDCPPTRNRNSIALYYYTASRPATETRFGKSEMTNYRERPTEEFEGGARHSVHQLLIRNPGLRAVMKLFRK